MMEVEGCTLSSISEGRHENWNTHGWSPSIVKENILVALEYTVLLDDMVIPFGMNGVKVVQCLNTFRIWRTVQRRIKHRSGETELWWCKWTEICGEMAMLGPRCWKINVMSDIQYVMDLNGKRLDKREEYLLNKLKMTSLQITLDCWSWGEKGRKLYVIRWTFLV